MIPSRYKTIQTPVEFSFKEKASKFITHAFPVNSQEEIENYLAALRKKYYDSRHLCYAWVLGSKKELYRTNDAGEPANTAGKPILGQITAFDLTNVLVVVVRYFGGTKLGVGGLIQAYKAAAQGALSAATIVEVEIHEKYHLKFAYPDLSFVMNILRLTGATMISQKQEEQCELICKVPLEKQEKFLDALEQKGINLSKHE